VIFLQDRLVFFYTGISLLTEVILDVQQAVVFRACLIDVLLIRANNVEDVTDSLDNLISDSINQFSLITAILFKFLIDLVE
jgi:hypothetical protein